MARSSTVKVIATSREGLRVGAEHLWPVPPLDVSSGAASIAVEGSPNELERSDPASM